ncbi:MAG TPA: hypothetical protein VMY05_02200 [Acidobacteriota bacterium]|nr:hypothetical protein [Acidobacteriota bacterium]
MKELAEDVRKDLQHLIERESTVIPKEILKTLVQILDEIPFQEWFQALERRNYLFHEFFFQHETELCNDEGCRKLLEEMRGDKTLFEDCVIQVRSFTDRLLKVFGVDKSQLLAG